MAGLYARIQPTDSPVDEAVAADGGPLTCTLHTSLPARQAVEATKRVLNLHLERSVLVSIDFALAAETESFDTAELQ